jgi:hypothetical protein
MPSKKCLACGQYFKACPQTREQRYCSKIECQRERRRRTKEKRRQSNFELNCLQSTPTPASWNSPTTDYNVFSGQPATLNTGQLPPGRYLLTRLDDDGIAKGHAWLAEIRILSAFPEDG